MSAARSSPISFSSHRRKADARRRDSSSSVAGRDSSSTIGWRLSGSPRIASCPVPFGIGTSQVRDVLASQSLAAKNLRSRWRKTRAHAVRLTVADDMTALRPGGLGYVGDVWDALGSDEE